MRKLFTILAAAVALSSCSITKYYVDNEYSLSTIENNVKNVEVSATNRTYSDELLDVTMTFGEKSIDFTMINNSNSSIKILWDDAAYMDQFGEAHRVIHTGVKLIDKEKAQVPTILPKGANVRDGVVPEDLVNWTGAKWEYSPIANLYIFDKRAEAERAVANLNPIRLLLPIEINGTRYEYTYTFTSNDASISEIKQRNNRAVAGITTVAAVAFAIVYVALSIEE